MRFSVLITKTSLSAGASTTENHGTSPPQYSGTEVFGVPPPIISTISENNLTSHPLGTSPSSESWNPSGKRSARGAALELRMSSSTAEYIIKGELNIRKLLGGSTIIKSGVFVILPVSVEGRLDIIGAGYGHGVGMCQDGAKALAKLGKDYRAILSFYYRGGSVAKVY